MALNLDFQEVAAQLQSWAAQFLGAKQQLYDARNKIQSLIGSAQSTGYVEIGGREGTLAELPNMLSENESLLNENVDLERKFLSTMEELKTIKAAMDESAEITIGIPGLARGMALAQGMDAIPVATIAWATGAAILVGSIAYFMSRLRTHLDRLAGAAAPALLGIGTMALIGLGLFLYLRR